MPVAEKAEGRGPLCPEGEYLVELVSVEEKTLDDTFNPGQKVRKWLWLFRTVDLKDPIGNPYELVKFTKTRFGHPKAELTKWLPRVAPGLTNEQYLELDTDTLLLNRYSAVVEHGVSENTGEKYANIAYIKPVDGKATRPATGPTAAINPPAGVSPVTHKISQCMRELMDRGHDKASAAAIVRQECPNKTVAELDALAAAIVGAKFDLETEDKPADPWDEELTNFTEEDAKAA